MKEVDMGEFQLKQNKGKEIEKQPESNSSSKSHDLESDPINSLTDEDLFDVGEEEAEEKQVDPSQKPKKKKKKEGPPTWLIRTVVDAKSPQIEEKRKAKMRPSP